MREHFSTQQSTLSGFEAELPHMPEDYYSGDQPNPHLRAFVEAHQAEHPYEPEQDSYAMPTFTQPIETTKATAIYNMHTYWSKKPHDAIHQYIRHYTEPGDLVLDPFCGSGGTALVALMEGRAAIAIDRSPAATFITKNYCTPIDPRALQQAFEKLKHKVQPEIDWLYATRCDRCDGPATTAYTVYSQVFECPRCQKRVPLFDCPKEKTTTAQGKEKEIAACPHCKENGIIEEISTRGKKFGSVPVLVSYLCLGQCKPARGIRQHNDEDEKKREYFERFDLGKIREIEAKEIPYWYPTHKMMNVEDDTKPWGVKWRAGTSNFRSVDELFTKRNLWALAAILDGIRTLPNQENTDTLLFTFTSILLKSSKMMAHNNDGIGRIQKGTYYIPQLLHDVHVWQFMKEALADMIAGYKAIGRIENNLIISTDDAQTLDLPGSSIDYIFTDPPYADKVQYGELNFVWEAWLNFDTSWHEEEIIVNAFRQKAEEDWKARMLRATQEFYRVLKPGRCISLCYHDTSEGTWMLIQDLMAEAGFLPEKTEEVLYIDAKTKTTNQYFADKVTKRDLVINFRKPRAGEVSSVVISGDEDEQTFVEKVHQIIDDYLAAHPGATKDRIYDEVVSRMVRAGSMEAHDFDELLRQVAEPAAILDPTVEEATRWFLSREEDAKLDEAVSAREAAAAEKVEAFLKRTLLRYSEQAGVHYSDIFEFYLYGVPEKPRRHISEWLPDYFYITADGTYRPPATEAEREAKTHARLTGLNRQIKRFLAYLEQGLALPAGEQPNDATLVAWVAHCRASHLYTQGRLLYERGGLNLEHLSDEQQEAVDEDYQVCVIRAQREEKLQADQQAKAQTTRKRGRASKQNGPTLF